MEKLIITIAHTGNVPTKELNPHTPVTVDEIVEDQIYPIRFFRLNVSPDTYYYFQSNEKIEEMLQVITKEHITKFTYLNKLFENSSDFPCFKSKSSSQLKSQCSGFLESAIYVIAVSS